MGGRLDTLGGFYISQIKQLQDRIFDRLLKSINLDINGPQGRILFVLWRQNDLSISDIGNQTGLANTTLTGMLERMVEKGMVARQQNAQNRRQSIISLTPQALAMKSQYEKVSQRMNKLFYRGFEDDEITAFENHLARIIGNLKEQHIDEYE
jgi:DNA-binding MarR family transcriptional regulator